MVFAVLAVTIIVAGPRIGGRITDEISYLICLATSTWTGEECQDPGEALRDEADYVPSLCQTRESYQSRSVRAQLLVYYDGETALTRIDLAGGGSWFIAEPLNSSLGAGLQLTNGVNASNGGTTNVHLGLEGGHTWSEGQIWTFDNQEEADEFEELIHEETAVGSNVFSQLWDSVFGDDPDLPDPDMELDGSAWSGEISGGIDSGVQFSPGDSDSSEMDIGVGLDLEASGGVANIKRTDYRGEETIISETHQVTGSVGANGEIMLGFGAGGEAGWTAGVRADRTEDGELQGIFLSSTFDRSAQLGMRMPFGYSNTRGTQGVGPDLGVNSDIDRQVQNTYVWVQFENDEQREIGEQFLSDYGGYGGAFEYFWETMLADHGFVDEDPTSSGDPWEKLVYDHAQVWQSTSDREFTEIESGGSASIFYVIPVGATHTMTHYDQNTTDAWYLEAPSDGTREAVTYEDCIHDGD